MRLSAMPNKPQWIAEMYKGKTGRDHLGLGSVSSNQILQSISPGVYVLTFHPRYYSFYVFLLYEFWKRDLPRNRKSWVNFYRPREFAFSLGTHLCDLPQHGNMGNVVGSEKTEPLAKKQSKSYNTGFQYIESELGGYGLYYRTVMAELGIIYLGGRGFPYPVDLPTEKGRKLAEAFKEAVKDTRYYHEYFGTDVIDIPTEVIHDYIHKACLCQAKMADAPDRSILLDILLHDGRSADVRISTFRLFLDIAQQTQGFSIDQDSFRQLLYFKETAKKAKYSPKSLVSDIYNQWRLYQTREYYSFALNALWSYFCFWGVDSGGAMSPIPLSDFWNHMDQQLILNNLTMKMNIPDCNLKAESPFQDLLSWLQDLVKADPATFDTKCNINSPIHEHRLYQMALQSNKSPDVMLVGMLIMLSMIYLRFGRTETWLSKEWYISCMGSQGRLSLDGFVKSLRLKLQKPDITIRDILFWIYKDYVIIQHQLIASTKWPDNTFRFHQEGNKIQFYEMENSIGFNDSRFNSIITTLHDMGLCQDFSIPVHSLTNEGLQLLQEGDL